MSHTITNNEQTSQYETTIEGQLAYVAYDLEDGDRIVLTHTIVPDALAGRGIAGEVVKHVLDDARARNLKVIPQCSYVAAYIKRHPEYEDLLANG